MKIIFPEAFIDKSFHQIMLGSVIPRPIALVSTVSSEGINNLAPFSYFNAVSSFPPILSFSLSRRKNGQKKDTQINIENTGQCVINMVNHSISDQMSLAGFDFDSDIDEFSKCGFTPVASNTVQCFGVKESNIRFECSLDRIIELGDKDYPTSLVICNVQCILLDENIFDQNGRIDPIKSDLIGRLGRMNYIRINAENIFSIEQNRTGIPIGFDNLPIEIKHCKYLSDNEKALFANMSELPSDKNFLDVKLNIKSRIDFFDLIRMKMKSGKISEAALLLMKVKYEELN